MSTKVYIHLELDGYPEKTSKIQIPKSWASKEVKDVIALFLNAYNQKNPDNSLKVEDVHLAKTEGEKLFSNQHVSNAFEEHADYYIKMGAHNSQLLEPEVDNSSKIRCRNYGCNLYYTEEENVAGCCQHHTAPPIFHDTMKCWSCCRDRKAYDFESFQMISGCRTGRHSAVPPTVAIADSPNATRNMPTPTAAPLRSIADYNATNPNAASAVQTAQKVHVRKSTRNSDGTARCQRKGCQKTFNVAENGPTACTHHKGSAVFHDAVKFWSCCAEKKCYDFDEFLAVPGCTEGFHDDGEIDLGSEEATA